MHIYAILADWIRATIEAVPEGPRGEAGRGEKLARILVEK